MIVGIPWPGISGVSNIYIFEEEHQPTVHFAQKWESALSARPSFPPYRPGNRLARFFFLTSSFPRCLLWFINLSLYRLLLPWHPVNVTFIKTKWVLNHEHWLLVKGGIDLKILVLAYKARNDGALAHWTIDCATLYLPVVSGRKSAAFVWRQQTFTGNAK